MIWAAKRAGAGKLIEIPVHYNGEDLDDVARELGISRDEVIRRHTGSDYSGCLLRVCSQALPTSVAVPGFVVPRRSHPRP